jgi:diguanylate cyclase (GGDEF)-like protein
VSPINQDHTLARQLSGAFAVFGALVGAAFLLTALAYGVGWAWLTPELERSRQAVRAEVDSHAAMIDEENGLRGYLITRDIRFLRPYVRGDGGLRQANDALVTGAGSDAELTMAMVRTRLSEQRWRENWAKAASDTRPGAAAPSMLEGKLLFDAYRQEQTVFAQALERHTQELALREQRLIAARVVLELAVFIAVLLLAVRQHRALREAIVAPVAALLLHIRRIRDGQLETVTARPAPRELAELAQGLNEVVRALALARESSDSRDEALSDHSIRLHQILDASREFSESLNLDYVVGSVRESTTTIGGYERVVVWLMDDEQKRLVDSRETVAAEAFETPLESGQRLAGRAAKSGRTTFEGPAGQVRFGDGRSGLVRAIAIPLIVGARVVGVLEARNADARVATKEVIEILEMLATHAATAIESARLHEVIEERSQVDALTRLLNRRRLEEDLKAECQRCARYGRPLAFVMLDVDHFKAFNDTHGHPQGDTALQAVADVISGCARTTDTAYRYGGEEFCVVLRETTAEDAMHFAERLRLRIEQRFESGELTGITASFGVAEFFVQTPTPRALVEAADAAMYESKHAGRNRVILSSKTPLNAAAAELRSAWPLSRQSQHDIAKTDPTPCV